MVTACGESSYEDCILKRMKDAKDKIAAREIRNACFKKHNPYKPKKKESFKKADTLIIVRSRINGKSGVNAVNKYVKDIENSKSYNEKWLKYHNAVTKNWTGSGVSVKSWNLSAKAQSFRSLGSDYMKYEREFWLKNHNEYSISSVKIATGICNSDSPNHLAHINTYGLNKGLSLKVILEIPSNSGDCAWVHESYSEPMSFDETERKIYKR